MKFFGFLFAFASLTLGTGCSQAQAPVQNKPLHLFLIGNSYSQNATRYLPEIAKSGGHELVLGRAEAPGRALGQHYEAVEAAEANPTDPNGLLYNGKSLRTLLSDGTWDIVTIQQSSAYSPDVDTYRPYAGKLRDFIKTIQPQAEVVMHQTWAYRADTPKFGFLHASKGERTSSAQEMYEKSREAYHTITGELGFRLIPNGDAFWAAGKDPKWGWKRDEKFDYANAKAPELPDLTHALNAGPSWQDGKLTYDPNSHSSDAGMYLGGLVWYGFLFHESPESITFVPSGIPADFAAFLRKTAAQTLVENGVKFTSTVGKN